MALASTPDTTPQPAAQPAVTLRAVALGAATVGFMCVASSYLEFKAKSAHMAMSNLPMTALFPFVWWLIANSLLKRLAPPIEHMRSDQDLSCLTFKTRSPDKTIRFTPLWQGMAVARRGMATTARTPTPRPRILTPGSARSLPRQDGTAHDPQEQFCHAHVGDLLRLEQ